MNAYSLMQSYTELYRGANGAIYDNGKHIIKVLLVDGIPITGRELIRVKTNLNRAPPELFPQPQIIPNVGIKMQKVGTSLLQNHGPAAVAEFIKKVLLSLKEVSMCYADIHLNNIGEKDQLGVLLDPDALFDPLHDELQLGVYNPFGALIPHDMEPTTPDHKKSFAWYCTVFSALCTTIAAHDTPDHVHSNQFLYTNANPTRFRETHAKMIAAAGDISEAKGNLPASSVVADIASETTEAFHNLIQFMPKS